MGREVIVADQTGGTIASTRKREPLSKVGLPTGSQNGLAILDGKSVTFVSVSAVTAIEWQVNTGTRTVVGMIGRSGSPRIFRVSSTSFISSPV